MGCSDDRFEYFRSWLIGQGQSVYENAIEDPDSLASYVNLDIRHETRAEILLNVAEKAYERKTGIVDTFPYTSKARVYPVLRKETGCPDVADEDCLKKRYPKTWEKFGWQK